MTTIDPAVIVAVPAEVETDHVKFESKFEIGTEYPFVVIEGAPKVGVRAALSDVPAVLAVPVS